jgi:tartrate dehydrogenase/decarboxylase/D-malate dehydrogenase
MARYNIAVIPGDGIGNEVVAEGLKVMQAAADMEEVALELTQFPWGCGYWLEHGHAMPPDAIEILGRFDAIYLGAAGLPGQVPESVGVQDVVLAIRAGFDQFANVRPVQPIEGCPWYLAHRTAQDVDFVVIREATEGFYCNLGGRFALSAPEVASILPMRPAFGMSSELAVQTGVFSEHGCRRVIRFAFELACKRAGKKLVTSATKSNALTHAMGMWDEIFEQVASEYPDCGHEWYHVDALSMRLITNPERFDVVVAPNLFGDILTDLCAVLVGGLGFAPGGNLSETGPSMFEPPHGSAPDIMGQGIANPIAAILTAGFMMESLGEHQVARRVRGAVIRVVSQRCALTPDAGGQSTTAEVGDAIVAALDVE